jgi:hypothetical protein
MKNYLLLIILGWTLLACRKEEATKFDGPSLEDLNGAFVIINGLQASQDSVDFATGESVYFTAEVSKISPWKITITGQTSGAVKEITGLSSTIDVSKSLWNGSTTKFPIFKSEMCKVDLTFTNEPDTLTVYVKVLAPKLNAGFLISDFESGFNSGWTSFAQLGANMDFQIRSDVSAPEGESYYNMAGTVDWDWLIGLVNFKASAYGAPTFPLSSNPNNVYFNVMLYGEPGLTNTLVLFQFEEDENGDGAFTSTSEDMYSLQVTVDWVGWKMVSVKYSDIPCLVNGSPAAPNGEGTHQSNKIRTINMLHLANPNSGFAKAKLDYMIFTENAPLNP